MPYLQGMVALIQQLVAQPKFCDCHGTLHPKVLELKNLHHCQMKQHCMGGNLYALFTGYGGLNTTTCGTAQIL